MGRLLVVDVEAAARHALEQEGHEVLVPKTPEEALGWAWGGGLDLVIGDANAIFAENGGRLREMRRALAAYPVAFVLVAGEGGVPEAMARQLADEGYLIAFRKPVNVQRLVPIVEGLVGSGYRVEGNFGDGALDRLLEQVETNGDFGVLTAYREGVVKKVVFNRGEVVFCGSNDPCERIGQVLIARSFIDEKSLADALRDHAGRGQPLIEVLKECGKIGDEDVKRAFASKFRESLLDLYLWTDGAWTYQVGGMAVEKPQTIRVQLFPLRQEGRRRADRWRVLRQELPNETLRLKLDATKLPQTSDPFDRKLTELAANGSTLGQIVLELRGQRFNTYSRCAELVRERIATVVPPARADADGAVWDDDPEALNRAGDAALAENRLDDARKTYLLALRLEPLHAGARRGVGVTDARIRRRAADRGVTGRATVRFLGDYARLSSMALDARESFVMTRIVAESPTVDVLLQTSPLFETDVMRIVHRFVDERMVDVVAAT